jgi:Fe(3+) dicitrate transport protein
MKKSFLLLMVFVGCCRAAMAQHDSTKTNSLNEIIIKGWQRKDITRLPDEQNGFLNAGKKNEVVNLSGTNANIAIKTGRQVFSKIPGVFVYDMDGSGNQINIATRGLDPHRSWELNNRQNGVITNSDMYGYPASHYSAPMESYERIEFIRGTGSLQYGAMFGGMINYITQKPDSTKAFGFESINTVGSFGLVSSYNSISGTDKKFSYRAYYYRRHSGGYRQNSESNASAQFVQLAYQLHSRLSLRAEVGRSKYLHRAPGPLNDSMFRADPQMSTRSRNYFSPDIYLPSVTLDWALSSHTKITLTASAVLGARNSVQLDAFATVPDTISRLIGQYRHRQVDIDNFNSRHVEARLLHQYRIGAVQSKVATGFLYMNNNLHRRQLGRGTTGTDYNLQIDGSFGRDLHFKTSNLAFFAENSFQFTPRWTVSPGMRIENGQSAMSGTITYYTVNPLPTTIRHRFALAGVSTQYQINNENMLYGGISQAYRPVVFKDVIPSSVYEQVDKNLKDAFGYNAEAGVRGKLLKHLQYDLSYFNVLYKHRMGTQVLQDGAGQPYIYRTNVGDARMTGAELFVQYKFPVAPRLFAGLFTSTAYNHARYINGEIADGGSNKSIRGNKVESVPDWITRNGIEVLYKGFSSTLLYSYTSSSFSDPLNTAVPPPTGARGFTPGYGLWDLNATCRMTPVVSVRAGISNLLNKQYFSKRPAMYPGPGIWPGDGRNVHVTVDIRL